MSIGEFAKAVPRCPAKALRLYDEAGTAAADQVDPDSGYRCNAAGQTGTTLGWSRRCARSECRLAQIQLILSLEPEGRCGASRRLLVRG